MTIRVTKVQRRIITLLDAGLTVPEVAVKTGAGVPDTVKAIAAICQLLDATTTAHLVGQAYRAGILVVPGNAEQIANLRAQLDTAQRPRRPRQQRPRPDQSAARDG